MSNFFFFLPPPPTLLIQTSTSITGVAKHGSISNAAQWICHTCLLRRKFTALSLFFFFPPFILLILTLSDGVSPALLKRHECTDGPVCRNKPERFRRILSASVCVRIYIYILSGFFFFLPPSETSKVTIIALALSLSVKTAIFTPAEISFKASWQIPLGETQKPLSEKGLSVSLFPLSAGPPCSVSSSR